LIPPDSEKRVVRAVKQWNLIIREHIRNETALKLSDGDARLSIPVQIKDGFPKRLAELIDEQNDPLLWLLILGKPKLDGIVDGVQFLLDNWEELRWWPLLPGDEPVADRWLARTLNTATLLKQLASAERVRRQIKAIEEDTLGAYFYPANQEYHIELYWMPIAMVAAMLGVKIEDLTVVTLAHELAHGYTHLGRDIEGAVWSDRAFGDADVRIKEGLAQFYTEVVTEKLAVRTPGPKEAFERLLELQGGPYLVHNDWLAGKSAKRGEAVRFSLVAARKRSVCNYGEWLRMLDEANISLGRMGKARSTTLTVTP
jgi:hypothetical protein